MGPGIWRSVFAVPTDIADSHLKMASGMAVKVLLLLLRHGGEIQELEMAQALGFPLADVRDAVLYWKNLGVILEGEAVADAPRQLTPVVEYRQEPDPEEQAGQQRIVKISSGRQKLSPGEINDMAERDENIAYLLQETQSALGKPLTPVATDTVVALYSYYGMQPDLVLMLIHYCVSMGKDNMRYIEKTAATWMENGIDTHEKAEKEILRATQGRQEENKIKAAFGIYDRTLVSSEKKYIDTWVNTYHMGLPLIQLAFERTVEMKGKLSFAYINGILTNWHNKGIATPAEAMREIKEKPAQKHAGKTGGSSYNMEELEDMVNYGSIV